jgi:hypothetical protein
MKASVPSLADAVDELKRPLATSKSVHQLTDPYDPTVLIDDDATPYICFGLRVGNNQYLIARLSDTMQSFAETPRPVVVLPADDNSTMPGDDKSTLHKRDGVYYLSAGCWYATSDSVYGPYKFRGTSGPNRDIKNYGLTHQAHGRYFTWRNQW